MKHEIKKIAEVEVVFAPMPEVNSVTIEIFVKAGSNYEIRENNGISHFLEHMFFKGGKKFPTPHSVAQAVDQFGGSFNAYTGDEYAGYFVKCAPDYIHQAIEVLGDMLVHAQFPQDEMEREKGVVIQELKMYEDIPQRLVNNKRKQFFYGDNCYGRSIIGTEENIKKFTREDLFAHKENLYTKDNLVIVVAGKIIDQKALEDQIANEFGPLPEKKKILVTPYSIHTPAKKHDFFNKKTEQNHLIISARGFSLSQPERYAASLLGVILGGNMSSRLFQQIREKKGLCYYISASHSADSFDGLFFIKAGIEKARFEFGLQAIKEEIKKIADGDISQEEFDKAVSYMKGKTQMGIESSDECSDFIGSQYLIENKIETLDQILESYQKVTLSDLKNICHLLNEENLFIYHIE
ncbi:MAG TPA: pitrilysin family protein [Candidatus Absconditabacterales bacterium]|nr:pitrilysin family protein [Candidatus Absconditabacterales bacterium]